MDLNVLLLIITFIALLFVLFIAQKKNINFAARVFIGLLAGIVFGFIIKQSTITGFIIDEQLTVLIGWLDVVGIGYTNLLKLIVQPLVFISILSAVINLDMSKNIVKIAASIITILILTTAISGAIGITTASLFNLNALDFEIGEAELAQEENLNNREEQINEPISKKILDIIPSNVFVDLAAQRSTSTLGIVIFAALLGISAKMLEKHKNNDYTIFKNFVNSLNSIVLVMVDFILMLTPFGVLAIMSKTIANTNYLAIIELGKFIIASYVGLILIFSVHLLLLLLTGLNPIKFVKKSWVVLSFAFVSRSSAAAIPINAETQHKSLGVDEGVASMAATLGSTIGQNGCAGIYPAMLAIMITAAVGEPITLIYIITLLIVIAITSFGVAGVGGGATYSAIIVLTTMGLPIGLAAVLISIEPVIDMGRTLINVNGSMVAGTITAKKSKLLNENVYNS